VDDELRNQETAEKKRKEMLEAPVGMLVCKLAVPTTSIMMVSALYNMADTYFVSSLGKSATGAVGVSFSLMAIIQAIGFFFGHGAGNFISRALGAKKIKEAEQMASTGFFSAVVCGLLITILGLIFIEPFAIALGSTETILPYAKEYLRYIFIGAPFIVSSFMLNNILRYQGSAFFGMIGMISGAVLNICLDPLFIFVFDLGVAGASLATMLSQAASFVLLIAVGCRRGGNIRISIKNFNPSLRVYSETAKGGTPSLLRQATGSLATVFLNRSAGVYGDAVIAAMAIASRLFMIAGAAIIGFGQSFQPICGFNFGAKRYDRVKKAFKFCLVLSTSILLVVGVVAFFVAPSLVGIFNTGDPDVVTIGALAVKAQCLSIPLVPYVLLVSFLLQSIGSAVPASILAFARQGLFLIPLLLLLVPSLGIFGIQIATPIADGLTFLVAIPLALSAFRNKLSDQPSLSEVKAEGTEAVAH
jgi:putative MATE family efflux protein